jgi:hypothetical protein
VIRGLGRHDNCNYQLSKHKRTCTHNAPAAREFAIRERTVVIRPRPTTQPRDGHLVTIEGLLVDLFIERRTLHLMDEGEYFRMFANLAGHSRVSLAGYWTMPGNAARLGCTSSNISKRNF